MAPAKDRIVPGLDFVRTIGLDGIRFSDVQHTTDAALEAELAAKRLAAYQAQHPNGGSPYGDDVFAFGPGEPEMKRPRFPIDPAHIPPTVSFKPKKGFVLREMFTPINYPLVVSPRIKDALEAAGDPYLQFLPIQVRSLDGKIDEPYFLVHLLKSDYAYAKRASRFKLVDGKTIYSDEHLRYWVQPDDPDKTDLYLNADVVRGRAMLQSVDMPRAPLIAKSIADALDLAGDGHKLKTIPAITLEEGEE